jgi:hypothetical protein
MLYSQLSPAHHQRHPPYCRDLFMSYDLCRDFQSPPPLLAHFPCLKKKKVMWDHCNASMCACMRDLSFEADDQFSQNLVWILYSLSLPLCYIYCCSTVHYNNTDMWACEVVVLTQTLYVLLWENPNKRLCKDPKEAHAYNSYLLREYTKYWVQIFCLCCLLFMLKY